MSVLSLGFYCVLSPRYRRIERRDGDVVLVAPAEHERDLMVVGVPAEREQAAQHPRVLVAGVVPHCPVSRVHGDDATYARPCLSTVQGTDVSCTRFAIEAKLFLSSVIPTDAGGGSLALPSISAPPSDSAFIEMGSGFIAFLPFLYPFLSPLLCLFSMV